MRAAYKAFSSEVETGRAEENAPEQQAFPLRCAEAAPRRRIDPAGEPARPILP
jgi:hypothetical protein